MKTQANSSDTAADPVVVVSQGSNAASASQSAPDALATEPKEESSDSDTEETEAEEDAKEESEDGADEESEESKDESKDKPKKKNKGWSKRVEKLVGQREAERRRADALEARLAALEAVGGDKKQGEEIEAKPAASQDGKPDPDQFESHLDYVEALTDWKLEQRDLAKRQEAEKSALLSEQDKAVKAHVERVKSFADKHDDFQDVLESVDHIPTSAAFTKEILESENGPELMYELAKNPEELERLQKLSPTALAREFGRMESRLSNPSEEKKTEPKKTTKAPKPIDPIGGGKGAVEKSIYDPSLTQREYEALRAKQQERRA